MSDWRDFSSPKKPPPAHGIKIDKAGTTWWGKRWIEALEAVLGGGAGRLARGRTYARAGRTHDLNVAGGKVTAKVTGSRAAPYEVEIVVAQLTDETWGRVVAGLAAEARFAAMLLAGEMPTTIGDVFRAAGASVFPQTRSDLVTRCSCPDWGDPCKHVAATHYVLGEALDRDPFLLFALRGRSKEQVLDALRVARAGHAPPSDPAAQTSADRVDPATTTPHVTLPALRAEDYDRPPEALPTLHFTFDAVSTHGALLRQLGTPGSWRSAQAPADTLAPLVQGAAETARRLALAEAAAPTRAPKQQPTAPRARRKPRVPGR